MNITTKIPSAPTCEDLVVRFWEDEDIKKHVLSGAVSASLALAVTAKLTRMFDKFSGERDALIVFIEGSKKYEAPSHEVKKYDHMDQKIEMYKMGFNKAMQEVLELVKKLYI